MDQIYREQLMAHYKDPQNRGSLKNATITVDERNPFCGDEVKLSLEIKDNKIIDASFDGESCAVSIASSSILTEEIKGKTLSEAESITKDNLLKMLEVELTTSRVKCAELVLVALKKALREYKESTKSVGDYKVTGDTNLAELLQRHPDTAEVLLDYGLHCVGCFASAFDTVEGGAKIHGFSEEEIEEMITRLNEVIEYGE